MICVCGRTVLNDKNIGKIDAIKSWRGAAPRKRGARALKLRHRRHDKGHQQTHLEGGAIVTFWMVEYGRDKQKGFGVLVRLLPKTQGRHVRTCNESRDHNFGKDVCHKARRPKAILTDAVSLQCPKGYTAYPILKVFIC